MSAPSVFNFYLPVFSPAGEIKDAGLVAPEFQITDAATIVGMTNLVAYALFSEQSIDSPQEFTLIKPDLSEFSDLADDPGSMVERIDLVFFGGEMDAETDTLLTDAVAASMNNSNDANLAAKKHKIDALDH